MPEFTIMFYNIEWMDRLFDIETDTVKEDKRERAEKIAHVIKEIDPHVLGICEAARTPERHEHFLEMYLSDSGYQLAHGIVSRGGQNLVFYYRDPFSVIASSIDDTISFYDAWEDDTDDDGLTEIHRWGGEKKERKPLEAVFEIGSGGPQLRFILVHAKSKGVFSVADFHNYQKISLANRKRLVGQAHKLRERLDQLIKADNPLPVVVMGDMNDGPGLDPFEKMVGISFVETVMGSVFDPTGIFHNAQSDIKKKKALWTANFSDPIVKQLFGKKHRLWLDHILLSPDMLVQDEEHPPKVRYVEGSGKIWHTKKKNQEASDHFPVYCTIATD